MSSIALTAPARRLGCKCESPEPRDAGSALCAHCGLVHLTSGEYAEHLARKRAEVEELLAGLPVRDEPRPRRWWRRGSQAGTDF